MWRAFWIVCVVLMAAWPAGGEAAAKKPKPPPKAIYEEPMRVVIVRLAAPSCEPLCPEWIAAEGEITAATPAVFRKVFKQMGKRKLPIIIRSPGGSINHAVEIGRMTRKRGLDVAVGSTIFVGCPPNRKDCKLPKEQKGIYRAYATDANGFCNSACPLILSGGVNRFAPHTAYVGVHKPKTVWSGERVWYRETYKIVKGKKKVVSRKIVRREKQKPRVSYGYDKRLRSRLAAYFKEMGVDPAILKASEEAEFKDMKTLTAVELDRYKLRTESKTIFTLAGPNACAAPDNASHCASSLKPGS